MNPDFKDLLQAFNDFQVEYLVVGGYAVIEYTEPRYTKDLDVWVHANHENAKKVFAALTAFGAPLSSMSESDFAEEGFFFQIGLPPNRVDILMSMTGLSFEKAWESRKAVSLGDLTAWFISPRDLLAAKLATGRPSDLLDAEALRQILTKRK